MGDDVDLYGDLLPASAAPACSTALALLPGSASPAGGAGGGQLALPAPPKMSPPPGPPPGAPAGLAAAGQGARPGSGEPGAPRWEPPDWENWDYEAGSLVVEGGEVVPGGDGARAPAPRPRDFDSLREELLADEKRAPARSHSKEGDAGAPSDSDTDGSRDEAPGAAIQLGEIRVSEVGAPRPQEARGGRRPSAAGGALALEDAGKLRRKEVSLLLGPPPPAPAGASCGSPDCAVLVGGLPWWVGDAELRRQAESFGQVRSIRVLDHAPSGRSAGIALVEFTIAEAARRAAAPAEGLCRLAVWDAMKVPPPRLVLVSGELFSKLRCGVLPWPDGGHCAEELRGILLRQFDSSHSARADRRSRSPRRRPEPLQRQRSSGSFGAGAGTLQRQHSGGSLGGAGPVQRQHSQGSLGRGPSPEVSPLAGGCWTEKLKLLKGNVNRRGDVAAVRPSAEESAALEAARRNLARR